MKKKHFNHFKQVTVKYALLSVVFAIAVSVFLMGSLSAHAAQNDFPMETPLWVGPYDIYINPELNIAIPDTSAVYWSARFTIPEGAQLEIVGVYPHARYCSFNSYSSITGVPSDAVSDVQIDADPGSENPFLPGAKRNTVYNRDFTLTVLDEFPPEDPSQRLSNTLYARVGEEGSEIALVWRIYVIDKNRDITGGVGLPEPRLILANGDVLEGWAAYDALSINSAPMPNLKLPAATYAALRGGYAWQSPDPMPEYFPAPPMPVFNKVFNVPASVQCTYMGICSGEPESYVSQYSNIDNQYMDLYVNRGYGEIVVIRGKAPIVPETYRRDPFMEGNVDMRFWSVGTFESLATTASQENAFDEEIPLDKNGFYTIVISLPDDRPCNTKKRNGVKWISWPVNGDGAGNLDDGAIIWRNMLPSDDFPHSIQKVSIPGTEAEVMGDYFPVTQYMSTEEFEWLGQKPWKNLPY